MPKVDYNAGLTGGGFYNKLRQQVFVPKDVLIENVCKDLGISVTPKNIGKLDKIISEPYIDNYTGKIQSKYIDVLSLAIKSELKIKGGKPKIIDVLSQDKVAIRWDRSNAIIETSELLQRLPSMGFKDGMSLFGESLTMSGFEVYCKSFDDSSMQKVVSRNMLPKRQVLIEPNGEIAQIIFRSQQIRDIIKESKSPDKVNDYIEKAMFYSVWNVNDRSFWLEYGMDKNVLDAFRFVFFPRLDFLSSKYISSGLFSETAKNIIGIEKDNLFTFSSDLTFATRPVFDDLVSRNMSKQNDLHSLYKDLRMDIIVESEKALDAAYETAQKNIENWSQADPKEKKHLNTVIKESFLDRKNIGRVLFNFNNALANYEHDISFDPTHGSLVKDSLHLVVLNNMFDPVGAITGNNFKVNIETGKVNPIFQDLPEKQGRIRLYERTLFALSSLFQIQNNNAMIEAQKKQSENDANDWRKTSDMSLMVHNPILTIQDKLNAAVKNIHDICKKNGTPVGVSLELIDKDDPTLLRVVSIYNKPQSLLNQTSKYGEGISGTVLKTGKSIFTGDINIIYENPESFEITKLTHFETKYHSKSLICLPLKVGDKRLGVLNIDGPKLGGNESNILEAGVQIIADVIEETKLKDLIILSSATDVLTGLYLRRVFMTDLNQQINKVESGKMKDFSLIYMDIDKFKNFNDTYGHEIGDDVLKLVGSKLKDIAQKYGLGELELEGLSEKIFDKGRSYRMGGEELTMVLPGVDKGKAILIANEIKQAIEQIEVKLADGQKIHCTVSLGVVSYLGDTPQSGINKSPSDQMLNKSDKMMYFAKNNGGNKVAYEDNGGIRFIDTIK